MGDSAPYFNNGFIIKVNQNDMKTLSANKILCDESGSLKHISVFSWTQIQKVKVKVDILAVSNVIEKLTGKRIVVSLVCVDREQARTTGIVDCFIVNINPATEKFVPLRKLTINCSFLHDIFSSQSLLQLADGPSVVWCRKRNIHIYRSITLESLTLEPTIYSLEPDCTVSRILMTKYCQNMQCHFMLFQVQKSEDSTITALRTVRFLSLCIHKENICEMNSCLFIPEEYAACTSCVSVKSLEFDKTESGVKSEMFIGTSEGFLVHFKDGQIQRCVQVFESAISLIHVHNTPYGNSGPSNTKLLVCTQKTYTFLDGLFKTHGGVIEARHSIWGDFLQQGEDQYLFLKGDIDDKNSTLIYDVNRPPSENSGILNKKECDTSQIVCRALKNRVQKERIFNTEKSHELKHLQRFISDTLERQLAIAEGLNPRDKESQLELLPLVDSEATHNCDVHARAISTPVILPLRHWQRTYQGQWCIGLDFTCNTQQTLKIWLNVIPLKPTSPVVMSSRSVSVLIEGQIRKRQLSASERDLLEITEKSANPSGRVFSDNPSTKCTITCVLAIPAMELDRVECSLVLNWHAIPDWTESEGAEIEVAHQPADFPTRMKIYTKPCGTVVLHATDVLEGKYEIMVMKGTSMADNVLMDNAEANIQDSIALETVQIRTALVIKASIGVFCAIESILTTRCGFLHNRQLACFVCTQGPLTGNQIRLGDRKQAEIRDLVLYTRCKKEVLLMIHFLYSKLPDEVVIECAPENTHAKNSKCLVALQKEVEFLQKELKAMIPENKHMELSDEDGDDVRIVGEKFKRQQDKWKSLDSKTIDYSSNPNFLTKLNYLRTQTDAAFIDLK
ncbi:uncharacterized protein LOC127876690 [Dreissena polymorpha]|uniref:Uncharacterized protein n=1 Tax=Dreissena polymorpha TaxID=45954 RepID=A0A9D4QTM5_DREPO|nr:uncharacterized protein LOC127876690 [Dreissena polymorpha]KAH3843029.1 hypothetical protein DPMN_116536 [Dreissena polymorpha]